MAEKDSQTTWYRTCFGTDAGKRVLSNLLLEAGYFDTDLKTLEELAVLNFAKKILSNIGLFFERDGKIVGIDTFVNKLFELEME